MISSPNQDRRQRMYANASNNDDKNASNDTRADMVAVQGIKHNHQPLVAAEDQAQQSTCGPIGRVRFAQQSQDATQSSKNNTLQSNIGQGNDPNSAITPNSAQNRLASLHHHRSGRAHSAKSNKHRSNKDRFTSCFAIDHNFWIRRRIMFDSVWPYYAAILMDFILRFAWTLTLIPLQQLVPIGDSATILINAILAVCELVRRCMWACFRLEWEHLVLTKQYTSVYESDQIVPMHIDQADAMPLIAPQMLQDMPNSTSQAHTRKAVLFEVSAFALAVVVCAVVIIAT
jgi:hypothetical protein